MQDLQQKMLICLTRSGFNSGNIVLRNSSPEYQNLNYQWELALPMVYPMGYLLPTSEQDIVNTIKCCKKYKIRIVAKGGGHSYQKYSFGNYESFVLDTRMMDSVTIDKSKQVATVGPGTLSGQLIYKLWVNGKYFVPTGVCPTVGMAGLSLGGGYGYLVRTYSVSTDSIVEMNVAVANGSLITVNKNKNNDMYFAMRGAGSSFGVVTKFIFRIQPAPTVFQGVFQYSLDKFVDVFQIWQGVANDLVESAALHLDVYSQTVVFTLTDSTGTRNTFDIVVKRFPTPRNQSTTVQTYDNYSLAISTTSYGKQEANTGFKSFKDFKSIKRTDQIPSYQKYKSFYVSKKLSITDTVVLQQMFIDQPENLRALFRSDGGAVNRIPKTETAFVHRTQMYLLSVLYETSDPNVVKNTAAEVWMNEFFEVGKTLFHHNESYQNYLDNELQDYLQRYYGTNLQKLVKIKKKYDPDNYFNNPQSIPTKL